MDEIRFRVAEAPVHEWSEPTIEPIINGVSLPDLIKQLDRRPIHFCGFPPEDLLTRLGQIREGERQKTVLLRCTCGDQACAAVNAEILMADDRVEWHDVTSTYRWKKVGPFVFDRALYEAALANPETAGEPLRDRSARPKLADGVPEDHQRWLEVLYMETDADPYTGENLDLMIAGLRAFRDRGDPITEADAWLWAKDVYMERPAGIIVGIVLAVNAGV